MTSQVSETTEALVEPGKQESMSPPDHFELERPPQKIALLFLSLGELHNEPVWRAFFEVAGQLSFRFQPPDRPFVSFVHDSGKAFFDKVNQSRRRSLKQAESIQNLLACDKEPMHLDTEVERLMTESAKGLGLIEKQQLFSVYSHPTRGYRFSEDSIFAGTEVPNRIDTVGAWASFSLVAAEIKLLKYALVEETNQKFILLSESCVPLYRPEVIYLQLLYEAKSRLVACEPWKKSYMLSRWSGAMQTDYLTAEKWRKSSQWFSLKRSHAEIIANDVHVRGQFEKYCKGYYQHHCVSDEHYIPTTLAVYGVNDETDCNGFVTATWWPQHNRAHPVAFLSKNITPILFKKLRHMDRCMAGTALDSTRSIFSYGHDEMRCLFLNKTLSNKANMEGEDDWVVERGYIPLSYKCPLFARKFTSTTVKETTRTALSCAGGGLGFWC